MIEPFCVGPGVFVFQLSVNYFSDDTNGAVTDEIRHILRINGDGVARSRVNDDDEPTNVALFYEVLLTEESEIDVEVRSSSRTFFIEPQHLQWGYKLYGSGYNLITETSDTCLS